MIQRHKQLMDSYIRVRAFLDAYPATGELATAYASARAMLDDVVLQLRQLHGAQNRGRDVSRMEGRRQEDQKALVLDQYIRPIVTIARSQIAPGSDVGLPVGLRMPKLPISPARLLGVCDGMIEAARPHESVFVANGLAADFLAQFAGARDGLVRVMDARATQVNTHIVARKGLALQLRRGRRAVERLDAVVRGSFRNNEVVLEAWRDAKRVHRVPGGPGNRGASPAAVPAATAPTLPVATPTQQAA